MATPRRPRRKVSSRSWQLLTVSRWRSPRRRSPALWSSGSWVTPRDLAQGGKNGAPSVTRSASGSMAASRWAVMVVSGRTAVSVVLLRSAVRFSGRPGSAPAPSPDRVWGKARVAARRRLVCGPPWLRACAVELPGALPAGRDVGFVGLDDALQLDRVGLDRGQEAMPPAERGGVRHPTPLGRPLTVSPSPRPAANAAQSSFRHGRAPTRPKGCVPVKALKVLPQPFQQ